MFENNSQIHFTLIMSAPRIDPVQVLKEDFGVDLVQSTQGDEFDQLDEKFLDTINTMIEMKKDLRAQNKMLTAVKKEVSEMMKKYEALVDESQDFIQVLAQIPPSMHDKNRNEHYPIIRVIDTKEQSALYRLYVMKIDGILSILRAEHEKADTQTKLRIAAIFHYKNIPSTSMKDLQARTKNLASMLKKINKEAPLGVLLDYIHWFEHVQIPTETKRNEEEEF